VIERVVKSTYWDLDGRTEVVFKDGSTLQGETVEVVSKLRPGQKVDLVPLVPLLPDRYGSKVMMMRIRVKESAAATAALAATRWDYKPSECDVRPWVAARWWERPMAPSFYTHQSWLGLIFDA
jgi:hypothetical protein